MHVSYVTKYVSSSSLITLPVPLLITLYISFYIKLIDQYALSHTSYSYKICTASFVFFQDLNREQQTVRCI